MVDHVTHLAERILAINWAESPDKTRSRGYLMKEYLRRAAWWAKATKSLQWPFLDIAAAVNPTVRADSAVVERVAEQVKKDLQGVLVTRTCIRALHFAALLDAGIDLPQELPLPFEPLIVMFERGGGFHVEGSGLIDVDTLGIRVGTVDENLLPEPIVQLDEAALDALDQNQRYHNEASSGA
ncbi:MAG: hypothetical protein ACRDTG_18680 [Pseudonocardiaceae bacterium]